MTVLFDINKLNKSDRQLYEAMTDSEKQTFERIWSQIETQKARLTQQKNAARLRAVRDKKTLAEKERKERTHRLIERGAMLESYFDEPTYFSNDDITVILNRTIGGDYGRRLMQEIKDAHDSNNTEKTE